MVKEQSRKKKITGLCMMLVMIFLILGVPVLAEYQIQDDAQLFSVQEKRQIEQLAEEIDGQYQMNVLVMTCDDANGMESRDVLENTYEEYSMHTNDARGGIAYIIDMDNRELNLVTERDMIYYITDQREQRIYDAAQEYASDGEYGEAMTAMLDKTLEYLKSGIPKNQYTYDTETGKIVRYRSLTRADILVAFLAALAVAAIVTVVLYRSYTVVKKYRYSTAQNAKLNITAQHDRLVNQFVTHRKIERNPPSGGDGGRTSTHHSSGGNTYGGGSGRKF